MKKILLIISIVICSCCNRTTLSDLHSAEALISSCPDSALTLLRAIDRNSLESPKEKAKYALLMSAALDKNYIDIQSDSLILTAVNYYSEHGGHADKMLSWYYQGICLKNAGHLIPAMLAFEKAEGEAVLSEDWLYLGLICRNKAVLFNKSNNIVAAIENWRKAISFFERAGADDYKAYAELSLAIDYSNEMQFELADSLLNNLEASFPSHSAIHAYCSLRKAEILVQKDIEMEKAVDLFRKAPRNRWDIMDYGYVAQAFEKMGKRDSADYWLSEGYRRCSDKAEEASLDYLRAFIEKNRGNDGDAFCLVDHAASVQDSVTRILLRQSVSVALADYYKRETVSREDTIREMKVRTLYGVAFGVLFALVLMMVFISSSLKKDRQLEEQMARLTLNERELERVSMENASLVGSLFSEKVDHLDKLCESFFRLEEGRQKELVFKQVKELASKIRSDDDLFLSLEKDLNRYCKDIMAKLRVQVPRIKGENLKMIMLFFAGLSYEVVYIILNKNSVESLKTVRSRFRKIILNAQAPDAELFLKMLEIRKRPQVGTNE